ncbi:MAG: hypothetical protein ACI33I_02465, partial [Clostridium sp.]
EEKEDDKKKDIKEEKEKFDINSMLLVSIYTKEELTALNTIFEYTLVEKINEKTTWGELLEKAVNINDIKLTKLIKDGINEINNRFRR